jgi:hypothetical protein
MATLMQQRHFEYLADYVAPLLPWPTYIHQMADKLADTNPKFNRDKFISRAVAAWEAAHPPEDLDDVIPY